MRSGLRPFLWAAVLLVAMACAPSGPSTPTPVPTATPPPSLDDGARTAQRGLVVAVVDPLTIDVDIDGRLFRVRYLGLRLPPEAEAEDVQRAVEFNRFLVEGKTVTLERDEVEADGQGRLLRYVYVSGESVNKTLLTNGYLAVDVSFPFRLRRQFLVAQEEARLAQRGLWGQVEASAGPGSGEVATPTPVSRPGQAVGTLPIIPDRPPPSGRCDFSQDATPVVKGNVDARTGERVYLVPGDFYYDTTVVDESRGDRWFCTEAEARAAGFRPSNH